MRRLVPFAMALLPAIPLVIGGCEDGPTQTFSPAAAGAGSIWNGSNGAGGLGDGGANVPTGTENYDASFGGTNANQLCTADQEKAIWQELFPEPILIPGLAAGIDARAAPTATAPPGGRRTPIRPSRTTSRRRAGRARRWSRPRRSSARASPTRSSLGLTNEPPGASRTEFAVLYNTNNRIVTDLLFVPGFAGRDDGHERPTARPRTRLDEQHVR